MTEAAADTRADHLGMAAEIVAAYVSNNSVPVSELGSLLAGVHGAISGLAMGGPAAPDETGVGKATAAQIRKSITHDGLVSFEDGKPYKTLRRHLTIRGLTPEAYRAKHGLPADYPMTSAGYSAQRSELARAIGLGSRRKAAAKAP
ncbi:MucR family transcriptional regulator [Methylobacterium flocculans]|uniref:MucR family transcriptional regulator n=1 Tax=Methylobacterium flocculans TaxID=2984843 RepID=UPI0021F34D0D|nr:MucR family transcriptional regulator [Methylobacterium sp. FF17]